MNNSVDLINKEDIILRRRLIMLVVPALVLGNLIHLSDVRKILGILCILAIFLFRGSSLTTVLFAVKPLVDMTWNEQYFSILGFSVNSLRIIAVMMFFSWGIFYIFRSKRNIQNIRVLNIFLVYFIFWSLLTSLFSKDLPFIISNNLRLIRIFDGLLFFVAAVTIYSDYSKRLRVISVIWLSNLFVMVLNIIIFLRGQYSIDVSQGVQRFNSVYNDPGGPAFVSLIGLIYAMLYVNIEKRQLPRLIFFAYIFTHILALITLYLTMTRGVILLFMILYFVWFAYFKRKLLLIIPILIFSGYFLYTSDLRVRSRFEIEVNFLLSDEKSIELAEKMGDGRIAHNLRYLNLFNTNYGFFEKLFGRQSYGVHNEYLSFLFQFGIIGLLFYLLLFFSFAFLIIRKYIRTSDSEYQMKTLGILSIAIMFMWMAGALWGSFIDYTTFWWSLVLILTMFLNIGKQDVNDTERTQDKNLALDERASLDLST
jgi:hypothetical protein